jgi:arginase
MKTRKQKNCSVASYNRQIAKYGKANCNIMYKCHLVKKNNKKDYSYNKNKNRFKTRRLKFLNNSYIKNNNEKSKFKKIILYPESLGQNKPGVDKTPSKFSKFINHKDHQFVKVKMTNNLYKNLNNLYNANKAIKGPKINIGGDHSMAIATMADTLNQYPDAKVIYFDAHGDINTYDSALAKNYHAMPLSFITGIDKDVNGDFPFIKNKLKLENLLFVGTRCLDQYEVDIIHKYNIKTITPAEINKDLETALAKMEEFVGSGAFQISFDVDCMDPRYVPSTGTVDSGGIELSRGKAILDYLYNKRVVNVDITELNVSLGSREEVMRSMESTSVLFEKYLK